LEYGRILRTSHTQHEGSYQAVRDWRELLGGSSGQGVTSPDEDRASSRQSPKYPCQASTRENWGRRVPLEGIWTIQSQMGLIDEWNSRKQQSSVCCFRRVIERRAREKQKRIRGNSSLVGQSKRRITELEKNHVSVS